MSELKPCKNPAKDFVTRRIEDNPSPPPRQSNGIVLLSSLDSLK